MRRTASSVLAIVALVLFSSFNTAICQKAANPNATGSRVSQPLKLALPVKEGSVKFAIIGDTGTGSNKQQDVADVMVRYRQTFPFDFVLMMGDNLYGTETPADYQKKFANVYQKLLADKVKFF